MATVLEFPKLEEPGEPKTWPPAEAVISMMESYLPVRASTIALQNLFKSLPKDTVCEEPLISIFEAFAGLVDADKQCLKDQTKHLDLTMAVMKQAVRDSYLQGIAMGLAAVHRLDRLPAGAIEALERSTDSRHQELLKKVQSL